MIRFIIKMIYKRKRFYAKEDKDIQELVVPSKKFKKIMEEKVK